MDATPMTCAPPQALADAAGAREPLDQLDRELVGLAPVKGRIRDVAALLLVDRLRASHCLQAGTPTLHMCFTGNHGLASRITHHIDFPNHSEAGLLQFAQLMPDRLHYRFDDGAVTGTSQ